MTLKTRFVVILAVLLALTIAPLAALAQDPTQPFTSSDGTLSFLYPEGWVAQDMFGTILLTNSQAASDQFMNDGTLAAGQSIVMALTPSMLAESFGAAPGTDPTEILTVFMADAPESMSPIETLTLGDLQVARSGGEQDGLMVVVFAMSFGDAGAVLVAQATPPGEESDTEPFTRAIIATMQASAPVAPAETGTVVWQQQFEIDSESTDPAAYRLADDIVIGADDTIYVLDTYSGVHVFAPDGTPQSVLTLEGALSAPNAFTVGADGTLWALDFMGTLGQYETATGKLLVSVDLSAVAEMAYFGQDLTFGPDGNLYLLNPRDIENEGAVGEVLVLSPAGELLSTFEVGRDEYFFDASIAFGPDGLLYVAERFGDQGVTSFDTAGTPVNPGIVTNEMYAVSGLAVDPDGSIYAVVPDSPILHLALDGTLLGRFGQSIYDQEGYDSGAETMPAFESGYFSNISGIGVLSNGDVVVADSSTNWWQLVRLTIAE